MTDLDAQAAALDAADPLAPARDLFHVPGGAIYLDGNSLGLLPRSVPARLAAVTQDEWGDTLIASWTQSGWYDLPLAVGNRIAPLIGAGTGEVAVGDSTSVNLFKGLAAALSLRPGRRAILAEAGNFPTDAYMAQGLAHLVPGVELRYFGPEDSLHSMLDETVAVVLMSHVDYRSAKMRDMAADTTAIHAAGALVLWDLSHSTGAVAVDLMAANADIAAGCTYKYLNGGPGAPAFLWVHPRHAGTVRQPLSGWMGHAQPFAFTRDYEPAAGARRLVCGTPQILSLSALDEALKLWEGIDRTALFEKSRAMTGLFIEAVETLCAGHGLTLASPREAAARGSHVAFLKDEGGYEIVQALIARGITGDYREPGLMRFGFAPLYLRYRDAVTAARQMADIVTTRAWDDDRFRQRGAVT